MLVMVIVALSVPGCSMATLKRVHKVEGALALLAAWVVAVVLLARTATEDALASIGLLALAAPATSGPGRHRRSTAPRLEPLATFAPAPIGPVGSRP